MMIVNMPTQNYNPSAAGVQNGFPTGPGNFPNGATGEQFADEHEVSRDVTKAFAVLGINPSSPEGVINAPAVAFQLQNVYTTQALAYAALGRDQFLAWIEGTDGSSYLTSPYIVAFWIAGASPE